MRPFGYINQTKLVGINDLCNNPFYMSNGSLPTIPPLDPDRTDFDNHGFVSLNDNIFDACAGPFKNVTKNDYVSRAIDSAAALYTAPSRPGTIADMKETDEPTGLE
jgi:hypothetical protein